MHLITKNIPTRYLVLDNGQEVNLNHFFTTIESFIDAETRRRLRFMYELLH